MASPFSSKSSGDVFFCKKIKNSFADLWLFTQCHLKLLCYEHRWLIKRLPTLRRHKLIQHSSLKPHLTRSKINLICLKSRWRKISLKLKTKRCLGATNSSTILFPRSFWRVKALSKGSKIDDYGHHHTPIIIYFNSSSLPLPITFNNKFSLILRLPLFRLYAAWKEA